MQLKDIYGNIDDEIDKIKKKYLDSADEIVRDYISENSLASDYAGRQMYELLQNADDEADKGQGEVLISLDDNTLIVSNTGKAFSFEGINSLLRSNNSPKLKQADKIGCKGLGFRSILTWSKSITVATKEFVVEFSKENAEEFLKELTNKRPELSEELSNKITQKYPIAILPCPKLDRERRTQLVDGYATSIIIECRNDKIEDIKAQIKGLQFEELIFLPNLKRIEIKIDKEYHKEFTKEVKRENNKEIVDIKALDIPTDTTESVSWRIFRKTGSIDAEPESYGGDDNSASSNAKKYEFIMAYDPTGKHRGDVLYSYFKTEIELGFPALIHGTFELSSERNSLNKDSGFNRKLIPMLAKFMVETAVAIAKENQVCNYTPLSLIVSSRMDRILREHFRFEQCLNEEIRKAKILPTIDETYISAEEEPKYSNVGFAKLLNPSRFTKVLKTIDQFMEEDREAVHNYIKNVLGINFYAGGNGYKILCQQINEDIDVDDVDAVEYYDIEKKVKLIGCIVEVYPKELMTEAMADDVFPHLLIDKEGKSICDNKIKVYPLPEEEIDIPSWRKLRYLNVDMEKRLNSELKVSNRRELVDKLEAGFNLSEYNFDRIMGDVVNPKGDARFDIKECQDILNWLWGYYDNNPNHQSLSSNLSVKVICRDGKIHKAKKTYMGKEYENGLGERLVKTFLEPSEVEGSFVVLENLGIMGIDCNDTADRKKLIGFLEWIGVSKYPRLEYKEYKGEDLAKEEIAQYIDSCYPIYSGVDRKYLSKDEIKCIYSVKVAWYEHLDKILEKAEFNDILAWFIADRDINSRLTNPTDSEGEIDGSCESNIECHPRHSQNIRTIHPVFMKSYLRYYLSHKAWIPVPKDALSEEGEEPDRKKLAYCCLKDYNIGPFIIVPSINYEEIKKTVNAANGGGNKKYNNDVAAILIKLGVAEDIKDLDKGVLYELMLKLPELDKNCDKARSIYRELIKEVTEVNAGENDRKPIEETTYYKRYLEDNESYKKFLAEGSVLAVKGNKKKYVPIAKARYVADKVFSDDVLKNYDVIDIEKRKGKKNVKMIFGVDDLRLDAASVEVKELHSLDGAFQEEYKQFLPYVYACRKQIKDDFGRLSGTRVFLCKSLDIRYRFGDVDQVSSLGDYEVICLEEEGVRSAYICASDKQQSFQELKSDYYFASNVGEIISIILNVDQDKDFYTDLFRDTNAIRDEKLRNRNDDSYADLAEAKERFMVGVDLRFEFWKTIAHAKKCNIRQAATADDIIAIIDKALPKDIDKDISYDSKNYDNNCFKDGGNINGWRKIFDSLGLDLAGYNSMAHSLYQIKLLDYWYEELNKLKEAYRKKYYAYLVEKFTDSEDCVNKYLEAQEAYDGEWDNVEEALEVDLKETYKDKYGVELSTLDKYADDTINTILENQRAKVDDETWTRLGKYKEAKYKQNEYLLFGKLNELIELLDKSYEEAQEAEGMRLENGRHEKTDIDCSDLELKGVLDVVQTESVPESPSGGNGGKGHNGSRGSSGSGGKGRSKNLGVTYSADDEALQDIGYAGEKIIYNYLCANYETVDWVSGNAERAHVKLKGEGNDTLGYDMHYIDNKGCRKYVEVKATIRRSANQNIKFLISESEMDFARGQSKNYEIFFVFLNDSLTIADPQTDIKPLGNIFDVGPNGDIVNNNKYTIHNVKYEVEAKISN